MKTTTLLVAVFLGTLTPDVISQSGSGVSDNEEDNSDEGQAKNNSDGGQAKKCPEKDIRGAVLRFPPYMILTDEGNEITYSGIVSDYIEDIFYDCCTGERPLVEIHELEGDIESNSFKTGLRNADVVFPVDEGLEEELTISGTSHAFYDIVHSPGYVLIGRIDQYNRKAKGLVLKSLYDSWPIFVLTFLLTGIAGVLIWALVSYGIDQITNSLATVCLNLTPRGLSLIVVP